MKIIRTKRVRDTEVSWDTIISAGKNFVDLKKEGIYPDEFVQRNLERFYVGEFGRPTPAMTKINRESVQSEKGDLIGLYPIDNNEEHDLIIYFNESADTIYLLSRPEFEFVPGAFKVGEGYKAPRAEVKFGEKGHQYTKTQKGYLREKYEEAELPEEELKAFEKEYNLLNKKAEKTEEELSRLQELEAILNKNEEAITKNTILKVTVEGKPGVLPEVDIKEYAKEIEEGGKGLPENVKGIFEELAAKHNVAYLDLVEKYGELRNPSNAYNYAPKEAFDFIVKYIDKPHFFADSKMYKWVDDEVIEDIVYGKKWPTTVDSVAQELVNKGVKDSKQAVAHVKDYLKNNPSERCHFKFADALKPNADELKKALLDTMTKYLAEIGVMDAKDYVDVVIEDIEDGMHIQIRNDLVGFYEEPDLIDRLNKIVGKYENGYFEPYDEYVWDAFIWF